MQFPSTNLSPSEAQNAPIYLHAELLPHIRHITLQISVSAGDSNAQTHAIPHSAVKGKNDDVDIALSESRRAVSAETDAGIEAAMETMKLPARVTASAGYVLRSRQWQSTGEGRRELSFRMQVDDDADKEKDIGRDEELVGGFVPWRAMDMGPSTRVRCRGCQGIVLDQPQSPAGEGEAGKAAASGGGGWVWKDLPSGNWAEMMDFWHCHKPDPEDGHDHGHHDHAAGGRLEDPNATVKGYGAANQVVATLGTVLVDVATFLVAAEDCLKNIRCCNCNALLGQVDPIAKGWRLFKTALSATPANVTSTSSPIDDEQSEWETHPIEIIVAAQLLELVERESARRFVVHCGQKGGLLIWVFNPDMRYSNSSVDHSVAAQRAMKVFFQRLDDVERTLHPEVGKPSTTLALEELRLPVETYRALEEVVEERNAMLPASAREFREWRVGILHRLQRRG
ncbi:HECT-type E3 ubiquitin transferase [Aspergillus saccharolyticus JOP 1030-1]|uniref:Ubiquitin-conjugating enzyme E2-binding protein n=1 Tax=Aspergillus saccharolyticus JOP 1030-1 TaxID=1450539 RepID=A0A318ZB56_9EURO|nr:hypothetical protein BP01DRAFT_376647 [Aspergillus saccharolyticus JOP 1030-1]PYH41943.1 hypothetical protein BP01DRAFT_376647 [Aspergillus saccharolyticus JOP 1030-1]